jgi:hypothetical protein
MRYTDHFHPALLVLTTALLAGAMFGPHAEPSSARGDYRAVPASRDGAPLGRVIHGDESPHACRAGLVCPPA